MATAPNACIVTRPGTTAASNREKRFTSSHAGLTFKVRDATPVIHILTDPRLLLYKPIFYF